MANGTFPGQMVLIAVWSMLALLWYLHPCSKGNKPFIYDEGSYVFTSCIIMYK